MLMLLLLQVNTARIWFYLMMNFTLMLHLLIIHKSTWIGFSHRSFLYLSNTWIQFQMRSSIYWLFHISLRSFGIFRLLSDSTYIRCLLTCFLYYFAFFINFVYSIINILTFFFLLLLLLSYQIWIRRSMHMITISTI